ncbi:unnamed protein product [Brugia pahangi]|uniref:ZP domain-containing protein n=1 Tax=Brugia pahangi TaxID=6280 RepID=A0A0N4TKI1_BRUPA|nr:unnamed protein product [Brugia pahangi]
MSLSFVRLPLSDQISTVFRSCSIYTVRTASFEIVHDESGIGKLVPVDQHNIFFRCSFEPDLSADSISNGSTRPRVTIPVAIMSHDIWHMPRHRPNFPSH